jgi:hypothetical protein
MRADPVAQHKVTGVKFSGCEKPIFQPPFSAGVEEVAPLTFSLEVPSPL